jgi:hypothetical protein
MVCDCGHKWEQHDPVPTKTTKRSTKGLGRFQALSNEDESEDEDELSISTSRSDSKTSRFTSKKGKRTSKDKNWDALYDFAMQRGTEDFKVTEGVIKLMFQTLRWGDHCVTKGSGAEAKMIEATEKLKAKIKPSKIGTVVNVFEWLKMINEVTEDNCIPLWLRIQWLIKTGGLADDVENSYRDLIIISLKNPAEKLRDYKGKPYQRTHDRNDLWYWDCMWIEILLWITHTFHSSTSDSNVAEEIKQFLRKTVKLNTDPDKPIEDVYTAEAQSVHFALIQSYLMAEECLSTLPQNPQYIYEYLIEVLRDLTKAKEAPQGEMIAKELERARAQFARSPSDFVTSRMPLTIKEQATIMSQGPSRLEKKHFLMITQGMMDNVRMGKPFYKIQNYGEFQTMTEFFNKQSEEQFKKGDASETDNSTKSDSNGNNEGDESEKSANISKTAGLVKVNSANVEQTAKKKRSESMSDDEDEASKTSASSSEKSSMTVISMEEDYTLSENSDDSGGSG